MIDLDLVCVCVNVLVCVIFKFSDFIKILLIFLYWKILVFEYVFNY